MCLCTGLEIKVPKKSPGGCRGWNVPRVTRGKRRREGIPGTAFLQVNPGWAIPPAGCLRPERRGGEAPAARQPAHGDRT